MKLNECLKRWAAAKRVADGNSVLLLRGNWNVEKESECAKRMRALSEATCELEKLRGRRYLPISLKVFLAVRENNEKPCHPCWLYSGPKEHMHPGCREAIARYFASEKTLYEYATNLS